MNFNKIALSLLSIVTLIPAATYTTGENIAELKRQRGEFIDAGLALTVPSALFLAYNYGNESFDSFPAGVPGIIGLTLLSYGALGQSVIESENENTTSASLWGTLGIAGIVAPLMYAMWQSEGPIA